ncbi:MAG: 60 kDa chaperonin [Candidatus Dichloromethanomonas elyunquensis]|nr:MAG: 60 kDa chaperonin [Candidatus Dichloromethanomonas elyunquensis]
METVSLAGENARRALAAGIDLIASCVKVTLGPRGRNVVLGSEVGLPKITNDGASIAGTISLSNRFQNLGCQIIKEVSEKTNDRVGDGTTTAIVLAQAMIREGMKNVAAGFNPASLISGIETGTESAIRLIEKNAVKISRLEEVKQVAAISSGDPEIGMLICKAVEKVGFHGVIMVEEDKRLNTRLEITEGIRFDKGCFTPKIVKSWEKKSEALEDAYILVADTKIGYVYEIFSILEEAVKSGRPLVIITEDISVDLLALLLSNKKKGTMNVVAVQTPGYGERRKDYLQDIAAITGATVISEETGISLEEVQKFHLGQAKTILVDNNSTTIIGGQGKKEKIKERCAKVRQEYESLLTGWRKEKLRERLGWLQGGIAVIKVGAVTRLEMKEKKDRIDDAVNAVRAAIEEGIVPGGGVALLQASEVLAEINPEDPEAAVGLRIMQKSLEAPLRQIVQNAGENGDSVIENIRKLPAGYGYNAIENTFVEMIKCGIIDPVQVTCTALKNAASIATLVIGTEGLIINGTPNILNI